MNKILVLVGLLIFGLLFPITKSVAFDELEMAVTIPLVETLDLRLDGSITSILVPLTRDFDYVLRIIFHLEFNDPNYVGSLWGEGAALANGTSIVVENVLLIDFNITQNKHLSHLAFDSIVIHDDADPKYTRIYTKMSFGEFCPNGIRIATNESLYFIVQDDMTAAAHDVTEFTVIIEGFQIERQVAPKQYPVNPFEYFNNWAIWALTQPLVWLMILLSCAIIIYIFRKMR